MEVLPEVLRIVLSTSQDTNENIALDRILIINRFNNKKIGGKFWTYFVSL